MSVPPSPAPNTRPLNRPDAPTAHPGPDRPAAPPRPHPRLPHDAAPNAQPPAHPRHPAGRVRNRSASIPFSCALDARLALASPILHRASAQLWRAEGDLTVRYTGYLWAMHALTVASVPLLERAASACARLDEDWAPRLAAYFAGHAEEERGHDAWLLADLAAAGERAREQPLPPPLVVELAGAQYYRIEHRHPAALLGYLAVLEGHAPSPALAGVLAARTGLPEAAFRTVREHADLDAGHLAEVRRQLDRLPLTGPQQTEVAVSALHSAGILARLFHQLAADPGEQP
ncbi:iron-containing redox enzyme family protein [Kitasatospora sp. NPDC059673]|uniref:iron-containing redox enzyme family protein n=1 Tax=Kitasatospora sp. NPDC059673 TaxID=3346901 RepID=UPI0036B6F89A